jgi:hypothetical protein
VPDAEGQAAQLEEVEAEEQGQEVHVEGEAEEAGEQGEEAGATMSSRRPRSQPYDASNGYRVVVWGVAGEALDPAKLKAALVEAADKVVPAQQP